MAVNPENERTANYLRALAADIEDGLIGIRRLEVFNSDVGIRCPKPKPGSVGI
jgi:hypothetical protein